MKYFLLTTVVMGFFYGNIDILKEEKSILPKNNYVFSKKETVAKTKETKEKLDFSSDNSITKYVSPKNSFLDIKYSPNDLVEINSVNITKTKKSLLLRKEAFVSLEKMSEDFKKEFNKNLVIVSSFRSYEKQKMIKTGNCNDKYCAKPGFSEHQTGLAVDIFETTTKKEFLSKKNLSNYFEWLNKNGYKYGFINTYRKGVDIDGYEIEPWHWRYVGKDFALELYQKNQSFGEYFLLTK